ncbi:MAG TPA: phosphate acyltransferase PlsX [bacterium]|nr:phosphate acyltransferase PlsX [bacterium]
MEVKIALDGMGGDNAPFAPVKAAIMASQIPDLKIFLVGKENILKNYLKNGNIEIIHCEKEVGMEEEVSLSILKQENNSMYKTISLLKEEKVDFALSAGNTAIFVTLAIRLIGLIKNIERPGIAVLLPSTSGNFSIFVDVGANINPKPSHLLQYGIMGSLYAKKVFGIENPRVALLNIGKEASKGDELRKKAYELLQNEKSINFVGNIEGQELFLDKADVIVTDGFTGNSILKVSEGLTRSIKTIFRREITKSFIGKIASFILQKNFRYFSKKIDYAEYGGGILLGLNKPVIISHGRSSPRAILNAIKLGKKIIEEGFIQFLKKELE